MVGEKEKRYALKSRKGVGKRASLPRTWKKGNKTTTFQSKVLYD